PELCRQQPLDSRDEHRPPAPHPELSILHKLFSTPPPFLHAGLRASRGQCVCIPSLQQCLGGRGGGICLPGRFGANGPPLGRPRRSRALHCSPSSRRSRRLDFQSQGPGRRGVRLAFTACLPPLPSWRGRSAPVVCRLATLVPVCPRGQALR